MKRNFIVNIIIKIKSYRVINATEIYSLQLRGGMLNPSGHEASGTWEFFLEEIIPS